MSKNKVIRYSDSLEEMIDMAVADGKITDKERRILMRNAMEEGIDRDEFEIVLEDRLREASVAATDKGEVMDMRGRRSVMSSEKLANLLLKENSPQRRVNIIKDFPIPSAEEDLLEFIMTMSAKAKNQGKVENDGGDGFDEKRAYAAKYEEACLKARMFFLGDSRFENLMKETRLSYYDRKAKDNWFVRFLKYDILIIATFIGFVYCMFEAVSYEDKYDQHIVVYEIVALICLFLFGVFLNNRLKNGNN